MKRIKRIFCAALALCLVFCLLPVGAAAAKSYDSGAALRYARSYWNKAYTKTGNEECAWFVSNCLKAGGLSSWSKGATTLYKTLKKEVENAGIGAAYTLKLSGNSVKASQNSGKIAAGDVVFWYCPNETDGCPYVHTALVGGVDSQGYVTIYQHSGAMNNERLSFTACGYCGSKCSLRVIHFKEKQQLVINAWISDVKTSAAAAKTPDNYYTGNYYYLWYQIYDRVSGKTLSELYPNKSFNVKLTWYDYNGAPVGSGCTYQNKSVNWYGVLAKYAEKYTCKIELSGLVSGTFTRDFTPKSSFRLDGPSGNINTYVGWYAYPSIDYSGCSTGITLSIASSNSGVLSYEQGWVYSDHIMLELKGESIGSAAITVTARKSYGDKAIVDTATLRYIVSKSNSAFTGGFPIYSPSLGSGLPDTLPSQSSETERNYGDISSINNSIPGEDAWPAGPGALDDEDEWTGDENLGDDEGRYTEPEPPRTFTDVKSADWYYECVNYCVKNGLFEGRSDGSFGPGLKMSAAELITILFRISGGVTDNSGDYWYSKQLAWAADNGLVSASSFQPGANIDRETFITMFYKTIKLTGKYDTTVTSEARRALESAVDYGSLSQANMDALAWSVSVGLIKGTDPSTLVINPRGSITRAEVCMMLMRYYENMK